MSHSWQSPRCDTEKNLPTPQGKDYFRHQTETPDTNKEIMKEIEQFTPYESHTAISVSHAAETASNIFSEEILILSEMKQSEYLHSRRRKTNPMLQNANVPPLPHEIHETNKPSDRNAENNLFSESTDSDNCGEKSNTHSKNRNSPSRQPELKIDDGSSLRIPQLGSSNSEKEAKYSSITDFSSTTAFVEQALPGSPQSSKTLFSDGQTLNGKRHTFAP